MWIPLDPGRHPGRTWRDLCFVTTGTVTTPVLFTVTVNFGSTIRWTQSRQTWERPPLPWDHAVRSAGVSRPVQ